MAGSDLGANPDALPGAAPPRAGRYPANGTSLYAEVRGSGPAVLLIGANDEDAEVWRPIAERLSDQMVVTYDRRGAQRSGREDWPEGGSARHADDAAGLLEALGLDDVVVFGASAGGIVALQVALRHPELVRRALIFEPGYFHQVPGGIEIQRRAFTAVEDHLAAHPGDWVGATSALGRAVVATIDPASRGLFAPPEGKDWYAKRTDANAEAFIRGDLPLTMERVDEAELASAAVKIRFAFGTASLPIFREIAMTLSAVLDRAPDSLDGVGHGAYFHPDSIAVYVGAHTSAE